MRGYLAALVLGTGVALALVAAPAADAGQDDPRLESLFAALDTTRDGREGERLGRQIAAIWLESGRPEIDALMREGRQYIVEGDFYHARERFRRVVMLAPDFAEGWNKRAHANFLVGNYAGSIEYIERALALEPRHFLALAGLGLVYLRLGKERLALAAFEQALEINPHLAGTRRTHEALKARLVGEET
jgi:tetratricopeptide (TPR) repeat protein